MDYSIFENIENKKHSNFYSNIISCLNSSSLTSSQPLLAVEKKNAPINPLFTSKQVHVDRDLLFSFDDSLAPETAFKLVKKIGNGSFGSVFQVVYTPTMRVFAGKLVNPFFLKDENASDPKVVNKKSAATESSQNIDFIKSSDDSAIYCNKQRLKTDIKKSFQNMKNVLSPYTLRYYNCFEYSYEHDCFNILQSSSDHLNSFYPIKNSMSLSNFNENTQVFSNQKLHQKICRYNLPRSASGKAKSSKNRELKRIADKNRTLLVLMEFCDRGSVRDIMDDRKEVLSEDQISLIMKNVLTAFDIFHNQHHIVHGGFKSSNILLNSSGFVKVAGFGLSKNFKSCTSKSFTLGLPYWMSPETINDNKFSTETDVWSIGITAIEMAEGSPPYIELKPSQAVVEICKNGFPGYRYPQGHSKLFQDFVRHCVDMNPKKRWTVSQLLKHPFITSSSKVPRQPTMRPLINKIFEKIEVQNCDTMLMNQNEPTNISDDKKPKDVIKLIQRAKDLKQKIIYQPFVVASNPDADLTKIYPELKEKLVKRKISKLDWLKIVLIAAFIVIGLALLMFRKKIEYFMLDF